MEPRDEVAELRAALHRDPGQVAQAADRVVRRARDAGDPATLSAALAVLGRARRALGMMELAETDLTSAIEAATAADDRELAADAHLGLAGVYAFTGRTAAALAALDQVHRLGSARVQAYGQLQRAALEQRIGHPYAALAGYEQALPTLRDLDARVDIALVLMNRGVIRTQLGDGAAAIADLTEAGRLFTAEGNGYGHAQTVHGLGWAYANSGDLPAALRHLDEAVDRFRELGHSAPEVEVDRAEVLLAAGLSGLAAEAARDVAERLAAAGNRWHVALAWLVCARAYLLDGDRATAAGYAYRARSMFADHGATAWERTARLELVRAGDSGDVAELRALAAEFAAAGNARAAATALALAAVAAVEAGDIGLAGELSEACVRHAARLGVFEVRMQARYAMAVCTAAGGDDTSAARQVRAGLADLRRHRATIAAPDAQAAVAVHADQLAALGLRLAMRDGSAPVVLDWMERIRAAGATRPAARPPDGDGVAGRVAELRATVAQIRAAEADGRDTVDLLHRQRDLERAIQRARLRMAGPRPSTGGRRRPDQHGHRRTPVGVDALSAALAGGTLVALAEIDGRLVGVAVTGGRAGARLADLGPGQAARDAAATGMSALRSLLGATGGPAGQPTGRSVARSAGSAAAVSTGRSAAVPTGRSAALPTGPAAAAPAGAGRAARLYRLRRAVGVLDRMLAPLLTGDGPVVLVVPPALHAAAWQLLPSLAGRPVAVAPSATWWHDAVTAGNRPRTTGAGRGRPGPGGADVALVVAGPGLATADAEAAAVARCHPGATVLTGPAATGAATMTAMADATLAHIACHGHIRDDNALWSSLLLFDGPLYLYDLERIGRTPPLVVLSGCDTGVGMRVGDQLIGLSTVLLRHGTRSLVAARCPLPDSTATSATMTALHEHLVAGATPAAALAEVSAGWDRDDPGALVAAALGCFGSAGPGNARIAGVGGAEPGRAGFGSAGLGDTGSGGAHPGRG
ncbi:CHAT domain-containing protein [Plantactinospora sp. GCM10030261]|uniref:CHAT domain-containing protein n=1 Tax=Plantactinospora sp. GCM10030261 TaxID=3273420 RepID=UPI003619FEC5